ncbi:MAG: hypothetical protein GXP29_00385 [Planctomycetes bacterium]|nr:hypothetical protein [Planctomycetota bacterium]
MPSSKRDAEDLRALCEQTYPDDGVNPRDDKKRETVRTNKHDRKLQQLCKQVESAMQLALPNIDLPCAARI